MSSFFRMDITKDQAIAKLRFYKEQKRLQGFLRCKVRSQFTTMKTAVRKLELGKQPSPEESLKLKVSPIMLEHNCNSV